MKLSELYTYTDDELFDFTLMESNSDKWEILTSSAFKKGWKKYSKDKRVASAFKEVVDFVLEHKDRPDIRSYPPQFNVHAIKTDPKFAGTLWCHLKGQAIGLLFSVEAGNILKLIHIGTHQQIGWS